MWSLHVARLCRFPPKRDVTNITCDFNCIFKDIFSSFVPTTRPAIPLTGQNNQSHSLLGDPLSCFRPFCTQRSPSEASLFVKQCEQRVKHAVSMPFLFLSSTKPAALMENKDIKPGALLCAMQELPSVEGRLSTASSATPPTL